MNPQTAAVASTLAGTAMAIAGVYMLAGPGWALIAGAVACFGLAAALFRGLTHAEQTEVR